MRKPMLAIILVAPFILRIPAPAHAASSPVSSHPGVEDLQEWRKAWQSLSTEDRQTLEQAWSAVGDALRSLTPEQRKELRAATRQLFERLSAKYHGLDEAQQQALQQALQQAFLRWVDAYRALDVAAKQTALEKLAGAIESLNSASAVAKAKLQVLVDALR